MKYLSHYTDEPLSALWEKHGAFFAFSNAQFEEKRDPELAYVSLGAGLVCPKGHEKEVLEGMDKVVEEARKLDMAENGRDGIIKRELSNYECGYTHDLTDAFSALKPYGIPEEEIKEVFQQQVDAGAYDNF